MSTDYLACVQQARLWQLHRQQPGLPLLTQQWCVLDGEVDLARVATAIEQVFARHELFSTRLLSAQRDEGQVLQRIDASGELVLSLDQRVTEQQMSAMLEGAGLAAVAERFAPFTPFLVVDGYALEGEAQRLLCFSAPSYIADALTLRELIRQVGEHHGGGEEPSKIHQFADIAAWQQALHESPDAGEEQAHFLEGKTAESLAPRLPLDKLSTDLSPRWARRVDLQVPEGGASELSEERLLTAWVLFLAAQAGLSRMTVGVSLSGRINEAMLRVCGPLHTVVPMTFEDLEGGSFEEHAAEVGEDLEEVRETQAYFTWQLMEKFSPGDLPFVPYHFECVHQVDDTFSPGVSLRLLAGEAQTGEPYRLKLLARWTGDRWRLSLLYDCNSFDPHDVHLLQLRFEGALSRILQERGATECPLQLRTEAEAQLQLQAWNDTQAPAPPSAPTFIDCFAQAAARTPTAPAVCYEDRQLTYGELDARANQLAHYLRAGGLGEGDLVALCLERTPAAVICMLGVLKAGCAYLPLDMGYPAKRLEFMLADAGVRRVLTSASWAGLGVAPSSQVEVMTWENLEPELAAYPSGGLESGLTAAHVMYVIYTSGSTGQPKGTRVTHGSVVNYVTHATEVYSMHEGCGSLVHSSIGFDLTVTSLLAPLVTGQRVILVPEGEGVEPLVEALRRGRDYSLLKLTPSHLQGLNAALAADELPGLVRALVIGGEALHGEHVRPWAAHAPQTRLYNEYGPTEATVGCCVEAVAEQDAVAGTQAVPIGRPIRNTQLYVLDERGDAVLTGEEGELYIAGDGLALDYLGRPDLTDAAFVTIDVDPARGPQRAYRTGDLVKQLGDGRLVYLGRRDKQVKIRGHRIELGEIEAALRMLPAVQDACATARSHNADAGAPRQLAAYVVWEAAAEAHSFEGLRQQLAQSLPAYMVPELWTSLDAMPLDRHGKIAYAQLPAPAREHAYQAPRTGREKTLCAIWEEVLKVDREAHGPVGIDDNYFAVGGDSIRSIQLIAKAKKSGIEFTIEQMFAHPTIRELLEHLDTEGPHSAAARVDYEPFSLLDAQDRERLPDGLQDAYPITVLQGGMIFHAERDAQARSVYHDIFSYRLSCKVDLDLMREVADELCRAHPVLRTTFDLSSYSEPLQLVHREPACLIAFEDLRERSASEQDAVIRAWIRKRKEEGFDIGSLPLVEFFVHRRAEEEIQFTLSFHHAVIDGWSDATMLSQLFAHYLARVAGDATPMLVPEERFAEYVAIEREVIADEGARAYWQQAVLDDFQFTHLPKLYTADNETVVHVQPVAIDEELSGAIKALSRSINVPVKNILLAAHCRVLAFLSNQDDVTTCMVSSGRPETLQGDKVLGLYINSLPMRVRLTGGTWGELAEQVFSHEKQALAHRRLPLGTLREMNGGQAISDALFYFTHYHIFDHVMATGRLGFLELLAHEVSSFPFVGNFHIDPLDGSVNCTLACSGSHFSAQAVRDFALMYQHALEDCVRRPAGDYRGAPLLDGATQGRILKDAQGSLIPVAPRPIHAQFGACVEGHPQRVALRYRDQVFTYGELSALSDALAHALRGDGVTAGALVGVCMDRSERLIAALLAIMKCGAAYVPVDTGTPRARALSMCEDLGLAVMLTESRLADQLEGTARQVLALDECWETIAAASESGAPAPAEPAQDMDALLYVIFTSGTTGKPKGVRVTHGNMANFLAAMDVELGEEGKAEDAWLALTNLSFDISALELFWPLTRGICLVLQSTEESRLVAPAVSSTQEQEAPSLSLFYFADDAADVAPGPGKYQLLLEGAKLADENGFEAVWLPERHFHSFGGLYPNPSVLAAAVASRTERVNIRSGSVVLPLHDPIRVAEEWSVVDNLSGGRVGLSLASGWNPNDFVLQPENYEDRKDVLARGLDTLEQLWRGERLEMERAGKNFSVELFPKPVQRTLPIWYTAAGSPQTFIAAGRRGANVLTHFLGQQADGLKRNIDLYRQARAEAGHDPDTGCVSLMIHTFVWRDADQIKEIIHKPLVNYLRNSVGLAKGLLSGLGLAEDTSKQDLGEVLEFAFERYYRDSGLFGTPEDCAERIRKLRSIGIDEVCALVDFGVNTADALRSVSLLGEVNQQLRAPQALGDYAISSQLQRHRVSHVQMTPGLAKAMLDDPNARAALSAVRHLMVGGEALPQRVADGLQEVVPAGALMNLYGPTEATVWSTVKHFNHPQQEVTIGRPLANTSAVVRARSGELLARGTYGDLWLGGDGIADGYHQRPEQTSEVFQANPYDRLKGDTLYRTGDIARLLEDGELEYASRTDNQIKLRGYRVELGDVEAALGTCDLVSEVAVMPERDPADGAVLALAAYVVAPAVAQATVIAEVRAHATRELPAHMRPRVIMCLEALPRTANGKLNRAALPAPTGAADALEDAAAAEHPTEVSAQIGQIWADVLNKPRVGPHQSFFELGGFSIQASQAIARMRDVFQQEMPLSALFDAPTPTAFAEYLARHPTGAGAPLATIAPRRNPSEAVPLGVSQRGVWMAHALSGGGSVYNEPAVVRIRGELDEELFATALNALVERHETLRLRFFLQGNQPVQALAASRPFELHTGALHGDADWRGPVEEFVRRPFDLEAGYLARAQLLRLEDGSAILALVLHHLISDGWSLRVFLQELTRAYRQAKDGQAVGGDALPIQYLDWVAWQHERLQAGEFDPSLAYWRERLEGLRYQQYLAPDHVADGGREYVGATEFFAFDSALTDRLRERARALRCTLFVALTSLFKVLLHAHSSSQEVVIATDTANRGRSDTASLIGLFVNQMVLRTDMSAYATGAELVAGVRRSFLEAVPHQEVPYEVVMEQALRHRARESTLPFQCKFVFQDNALGGGAPGDWVFDAMDVVRGTSKFEFLLNAADSGDRITFSVEYDAAAFEHATITHLVADFTVLAQAFVDAPHSSVEQLVQTTKAARAARQDHAAGEFARSKEALLDGIRSRR